MTQRSGIERMVKTIHIKSYGRTAEILLDGIPVQGVLSYQIEHDACSLPTLLLTLRAEEIVIDGEYEVVIREAIT